jgi:hypothetical protein
MIAKACRGERSHSDKAYEQNTLQSGQLSFGGRSSQSTAQCYRHTALCRSATGRAIQVKGSGGLAQLQQPSLAVTVRILLCSVNFNDDCLIDITFMFVY